MYTFYHNPRCKISRQVLEDLRQKVSEEIIVIDYMQQKFTHEKLEYLLRLLNIEPFDLIRKKEAIYVSQYKNKQFSREEWIQIMIENPKLIERPIVVKGYKGLVCRPPERVDELISK